ncbi:MAG: DUF1735 and LamG domain-containing protein [Phocaeicola sp.]
MKVKNIYTLLLALLTLSVASCADSMENFDNHVYVDASVKTTTVLLKSTLPTVESTFHLAMAKPESEIVSMQLTVDSSLVSTYNMAYYDQAEMLPAEHYTLEKGEPTIAAGSTRSTEVKIVFNNLTELDKDRVYVVPVTVTSSTVPTLASARTMYYVLKGAALINVVANMSKNLVFVTWETPSEANNLRQLTAEALIRVDEFDKNISTIMGIEGHFLLRIGDSGVPSDQLQIATSSGNKTSSDLVIPKGEWTHIAVTYDADAKNLVVYLNGKNKLETSLDCGAVNWGRTKTDEGNGFWIGHSYNRGRWLEGDITECRVWNRVLTQEEINATDHFYEVAPASEGLIGYWKFDEGAGNSIADYSGLGNHATAVEALSWRAVELPAKK